MPDYIAKVSFESRRCGEVTMRLRSEQEGLKKSQVQALFDGLRDDVEFVESLEAADGKTDTCAAFARILEFKESKIETVGSIDLDIDEYAIPEAE